MATKTFQTRVCSKRDTEANWKRLNPVLLNGEIIIVDTTTGETRIKIGDGQKRYNDLPFNDEKIRTLIDEMVTLYIDADGSVYVRKN